MACAAVDNIEIDDNTDLWDQEDESTGDKLVFPEFDSIKVSTKTFIVMTNMTLDIDKLFNYLPITEYIWFRRDEGGRRKMNLLILIRMLSPVQLSHWNTRIRLEVSI